MMLVAAHLALWAHRAWNWLKQDYRWFWVLVFPITLLLLLSRRSVTVSSGELVEHEKVKAEIEEGHRATVEAFEEKKRDQEQAVVAGHAQKADEIDAQAEKRVEETGGDPEEVNDFLKEVGRKMRE